MSFLVKSWLDEELEVHNFSLFATGSKGIQAVYLYWEIYLWILICLLFRYTGRTQKELAEYVRENYVAPTTFER